MRQFYYNGNIITMEGSIIGQSFTVEDGYFIKINDPEPSSPSSETEWINLQGKTVMPAFLDAHSHLSSYANSFLQAQLDDAGSFEDIINRLNQFAQDAKVPANGWISGVGYDHNALLENAHPTRSLLDQAFPTTAVVLHHQSRHFGVFNTTALHRIGLDGMDHDGYLEENAFVDAVKKIPMPAPDQMMDAYKKALRSYATYGITTIQEGMMVKQMLPFYQMLLHNKVLTLDIIGYPQIADGDIFYDALSECTRNYHEHFRLGGYKIILDGSPQGRTAWMRSSYKGSDNAFGVSTMTDDEVFAAVQKAVQDKRQLLAHCNGDAAVEQLLTIARQAASPQELKNIRPVIIHGQLLSKDQLPQVKGLGMIPSFFIAHCYYWGDTHIKNFGLDRAATICPAKSALNQRLLFTFHQDTPVIKPDMLETIWCAVTRQTRNGIVLGADEQIPVYEALRAVTINAAYQYGEKTSKGSITPGKIADFIILDVNPLDTVPKQLKEISILATYKSGVCIYRR